MGGNYGNFFIKIVVLTIVTIFAGTGVILSSIMLFSGRFKPELLGLLVMCLFLTCFGIYMIIKINNDTQQDIKQGILSDNRDVISQWKIPVHTWKAFIAEQKKIDADDVKGTALIGVGVGAVIGFIMGIAENDIGFAIGTAAAGAAALGLFLYIFMKLTTTNAMKKLETLNDPTVHFSKDALMIGEQLVLLNFYNHNLKSVMFNKERTTPVITFVVHINAGRRSNDKEYHVPVPEEKMNEANGMVQFYKTLQPV